MRITKSYSLDKELIEQLEKSAKANNRKFSAELETAIQEYLKKEEKSK